MNLQSLLRPMESYFNRRGRGYAGSPRTGTEAESLGLHLAISLDSDVIAEVNSVGDSRPVQ